MTVPCQGSYGIAMAMSWHDPKDPESFLNSLQLQPWPDAEDD